MLEILTNSKSKNNNINSHETIKESQTIDKNIKINKSKKVSSNQIKNNKLIINRDYISNKYFTFIAILLLLYNNNILIPAHSQATINNMSQSVTLIFRGKGRQMIFGSNFYNYDNISVVVNGTFESLSNNAINFTDEEALYQIDLNWLGDYNEITSLNNMFSNVTGLLQANFSCFDFRFITDMSNMFANCTNIESVIFPNHINTSIVRNLRGLFYGCVSLKSINNLADFNTTLVTNMGYMFYNCISLKSLNLSGFNTSATSNMEYMFKGCKNLEFIDISNFDLKTSNPTMTGFFENCTNIEYINMENLIEGNVSYTYNLFSQIPERLVYCAANYEGGMFYLLIQLENVLCSVNDCSDNWRESKLRLKKVSDQNEDFCVEHCAQTLNYKFLYNNTCLAGCPSGTHSVTIDDEKECIIDCPEGIIFEKNGICDNNCSSKDFLKKICKLSSEKIEDIDNIINKISQEIINSTDPFVNENLKIKYENMTFHVTTLDYMKGNEYANETLISLRAIENDLKNEYVISNNETLPIFKIDYNFEEFMIPITEYQTFILKNDMRVEADLNKYAKEDISIKIPVIIDENEIYKYNPLSEYYNNSCFPNYSSSENCEDEFILYLRKKEYNERNMQICERNCSFVNYNPNTQKVECLCKVKTSFSSLSELYNIKQNKNNLFFYFDAKYDMPTTPSTIIATLTTQEPGYFPTINNSSKISEIFESINTLLKSINISSESNNLDELISSFISSGGENLKIEEENITFLIIPSEEQDEFDNVSYINLGECGERLRTINNISDNYSLIISKIDFYNSGYSIPKVEYDVYDPIKKVKLNLDVCNDTKIDILVPVVIDKDEIFLYNTSSGYYRDLCFPYTTEEGTDIILTDRKNQYVNNNMSLCEDNCTFSDYNSETKKAVCNCEIKIEKSLISEIKQNKEKILKNFLDIKSKINLNTMKCYKLVFSKNGQDFNIGSYILLVFIFTNIVLVILFKLKGFELLSKNLDLVKSMLKSKTKDETGKKKIKITKI